MAWRFQYRPREVVDVFAQLGNGFEGSTAQRFSFEDRKPDLDLIEPGCSGRREVELHVGMTLEPAVIFGLMGIEVIEDDVDGSVRVSGDDAVHEVEKLDAPPAIFVSSCHFAGCHFESGKQGRGAVALVVVAAAGKRCLSLPYSLAI